MNFQEFIDIFMNFLQFLGVLEIISRVSRRDSEKNLSEIFQ
jgi:hypothetical protein